MNRPSRFALTLLALLLTAACNNDVTTTSTAAAVETPQADLIFTNGAVYTVDASRSWATAVAVRDGKIVFVGHDAQAKALAGPNTELVDLKGRMLMPSFQDSHVHPIGSGREALAVDLSGTEDLDEYLAIIKTYADNNPDEPWILGAGWSMATFGPSANASRALLDAVVADRPVYITSRDGHSGWANSKAMEIAGIDRATPNPASGIIDRDPKTGDAIGSLQEGAMELVTQHIPVPSAAKNEAGLKYSMDMFNRFGITAIIDASVFADDLAAYQAMDQRGELKLRVLASMFWQRDGGLEQVEQFKTLRQQYTAGNVRANAIKIMQDGVLENYTGALSAPYLVDGNPTGIPMIEPDFLKQAVSALDAAGFQVHFHAIGDAAITQCLDAVATAIEDNGNAYRRHHISHLQLINPNDLPRFRELSVVANFQPLWAYADKYVTELTIPFIGEERASWMYPLRSVVNHGGMIAFGSDWSVSTANPFPQIETAVLRQDADGDGSDPVLNASETIDLQTAVAAFTINAAYVGQIDAISGSIEVGKMADMIVLDRNIFAIPATEISETQVLLTLLDGKPVYGTLHAF